MSKALTNKTLYLAGLAGCLLTLGTVRAEAGPIGLSISAPFFSAPAGSSGSFNVTLTNNNEGAVSVGGFEFHLSTMNPGITFTGADMSTTPAYIFGSDSLDVALMFSFTTQTGTALDASDNPNSVPSYSVLGGGTTVGLGRVFYQIAGGAATGPFAITLDPTFTILSTSDSVTIPANLINGSINVTSSAPEPATFALVGFVFAAALVLKRRKSGTTTAL